mgnify:CR=1 FL=1
MKRRSRSPSMMRFLLAFALTSRPGPRSPRRMGIYIPANKRAQLLKYKYSSTDKSLTSVRPPRAPRCSRPADPPASPSTEVHPEPVLEPARDALPALVRAEPDHALRPSARPSQTAEAPLTAPLGPQGLLCVVLNFLTLLYFNPTLSCGTKPLHVSKGGSWDPLFRPLTTAPSASTFWNPSTWFSNGTASGASSSARCSRTCGSGERAADGPRVFLCAQRRWSSARRDGCTLRSPSDCSCTSRSTRSMGSRRGGRARVARSESCLTTGATPSTPPCVPFRCPSCPS